MTTLELCSPLMEPPPRLEPYRPGPGRGTSEDAITIVPPGAGTSDDLAAVFGAGAAPVEPVVLDNPILSEPEAAPGNEPEPLAGPEGPVVPLAADAEVAFDALYRAEVRAITNLIQSLTGRRDVAEEIVQDAFVVTHDRWRRVSTYDRPADFVRRVALNRALSSLRRRKAEHRALERWQHRSPQVVEDRLPLDGALWQAVRRLPNRQARAVALTYVEDLPIARVAEILGCSENTVKTHLKRARSNLAAQLADAGETRSAGAGGERRG
jgi:RNA polymerase sigma factor (sigma-70 family)